MSYPRSYYDILTEVGIPVNRSDFNCLSEASRLAVTDEQVTGMMKFITDKYNSLDFSEIEKSAGDITRFKYGTMIRENLSMLAGIYNASADPGAEKYHDVAFAGIKVMEHLERYRRQYSDLYKQGNGIVQLVYTSLVAACLYATGILVSNTIRFVTTEQETDCEVLFEEIPGTIKHIHIKNLMAAADSLSDITKLLDQFSLSQNRKVMSESITLSAGAVTTMVGVGAIIILLPRIIHLIREIIYSVYYFRVKTADMLDLQVNLIRTNIESLDARKGSGKVIARQRKIAQSLENWKNRIAVKADTVEVIKNTQMRKENETLSIEKGNPMITSVSADPSGILL